MHELLVSGPVLDIIFKMKVLHGHDEKSSGTMETIISAREMPGNIQFRAGSNVSDWELRVVQFRNSLN